MKKIYFLLSIFVSSVFFVNSVFAATYHVAKKKLIKIPNNKVQALHVPILMYHHIVKRSVHEPYSVSPDVFDQQMNWLKQNDYQVVTYADFYQSMLKNKVLPKKSVVITFDDGDVDQYSAAWPILKKYHYSALFYITTNFIGHRQWMDWKMLKELSTAGNMEIGAHTMSHPNLSKLSSEKQWRELKISKDILEKNLKTKINFFAYPGGAHNTSTVALLQKAGYLSAVTTRHNVFHLPNENLYLVSRIHIDDDLPSFIQFVEGTRVN